MSIKISLLTEQQVRSISGQLH